ncbi:hypothetical protein ASPZODRAFT_26552 [Penicilliopsis zonata CBS 506.65]|uniref:glutathione transferase n=1 Tax=Penicilliopsis zonata CBS 506.65 TaxID=1073090 RepID=A0A1L9SFJ9_9EURO|nr:hypothetical protein ASPZODRAFT_26552 [Penicilliopsis zonata CBS 506.65]OJJ45959.1 hypothetical protein ASPZODRAFT_26552 [Penicilliopsis zonata CBS 506.65]
MDKTLNVQTVAVPPVKYGNIAYSGAPIIYVVKATKTSYINYMKVLMLAAELGIDHEIAVISTKDEWYQPVHPERYVPAIADRDPATGEDFYVFESTSCLHHLADTYDTAGLWRGRTVRERAQVQNWTAYQTAGLGATSKYWLYFSNICPDKQPKTIEKLYDNCLKQWDILEARLSAPGQDYIALPDRPTVADIAYFPFAMPYMFQFMGVEMARWPRLQGWAARMAARPAIQHILEFAPTIGSD